MDAPFRSIAAGQDSGLRLSIVCAVSLTPRFRRSGEGAFLMLCGALPHAEKAVSITQFMKGLSAENAKSCRHLQKMQLSDIR